MPGFLTASLLLSAIVSPFVGAVPHLAKRGADFVDPHTGGGQMGANGGGVLEPVNVIISANSSPDVLTDDGFQNYVKSLGLSIECLGIHGGGQFSLDLGDGNGPQNQTLEMRYDFGVSFLGLGTCLETLTGGNHLRFVESPSPECLGLLNSLGAQDVPSKWSEG